MAVIIRKKVIIDGTGVELKTYQPPGRLTKDERQRADRLDSFLKDKVPQLAQNVEESTVTPNAVSRWFRLGKTLRSIVDDRSVVSSEDISNGLIWQAIWHYLPGSLKPSTSDTGDEYSSKQHKRKDHLSLCYEISSFEWRDVAWIQRWDDWHQLAFRPGLLRDPRIIRLLGKKISELPAYPTREEFRTAIKRLGESFPTRRHRDSSLLSDDTIDRFIVAALRDLSEAQET